MSWMLKALRSATNPWPKPAAPAEAAPEAIAELSTPKQESIVAPVVQSPPAAVEPAKAPEHADEIPELESLLEAVLRLEDAARIDAPPERVSEVILLDDADDDEDDTVLEEAATLPQPAEFVPVAFLSHAGDEGVCAGLATAADCTSLGAAFDLPASVIAALPPREWTGPLEEPVAEHASTVEPSAEGVGSLLRQEPGMMETLPAEKTPDPLGAAAPPEPSALAPVVQTAPRGHTAEPAPRLSVDYRFREIAQRPSQHHSPLELELAAALADPLQGPPLRRAAHSILLHLASGPGRVILLVGVGDEPHVSHVAGALAMILAAEERARTLLIDAQPESRRLSRGFGHEKGLGLADALRGQEAAAIALPTATDRLFLTPYGSGQAETLPELWETLLMDLKRHRDFVIVDARADVAQHLARFADGAFLIIHRGQTDGDAAAALVHDLRSSGGRVLGCVLTDAV